MHCDQVSKFFAFKEMHEKMISSYTVSESKTSTGHGIAKEMNNGWWHSGQLSCNLLKKGHLFTEQKAFSSL